MRLTAALERDLDRFLGEVEVRGAPSHAVKAAQIRKALKERREPQAAPPGQSPLWESNESGAQVPWRGRLGPSTPVRCDRFSTPTKPCILPLKTCLQRQDAVWPGKKAKLYDVCQDCAQGAEYKRRAAYSAAADWASRSKNGRPTYQPFRKDSGLQRKKMAEFDARARAERIPTLEEPPAEEPQIEEKPAPAAPPAPELTRKRKGKGRR